VAWIRLRRKDFGGVRRAGAKRGKTLYMTETTKSMRAARMADPGPGI